MNVAGKLFDESTQGFHTDICGYSHAIYEQYTNCSRLMHGKMLDVLEFNGIEYHIFAGSMVGYVRNKKMPVWMDDLDIMIFEDQIDRFWKFAAPALNAAGFNCRPIDKPFEGGGAHILGMQLGNRRDHTIPLSKSIEKSVPWAQIDVFFSKVTETGKIKNLTGWGLYHSKNVEASWIFPGVDVSIDGRRYRVFSDYEQDVRHEYGDVLNNIIVQTHDRVFLRVEGVPWSEFERDFTEKVSETTSFLLPGIENSSIEEHHYNKEVSFATASGMTLSEIAMGIIKSNAARVTLCDEKQILFSMDLKRLFPKLEICASANSIRFSNHAAHLSEFIDEINIADRKVNEHYESVCKNLAIIK